jgi:hypothetical protein
MDFIVISIDPCSKLSKKRKGKVYKPPSNYHQIDNVPLKLSIVTMSPLNYQNIVNVHLNDETALNKKILKLLERKHKTKKKLKKIQRVEN